jgi:trimethylamine--corrinoid protein Co-methyltransferase
LHSWNPAHNLHIGGRWMAYGTVGSAPHYIDREGVRRTGDRDGFRDLLKLAQMLNTVHFIGGYPVEPVDVHHSVRHIHAAHDVLTLTDKSLHCYSLGRQRNRDVIEMARISRGVDDATILREPSVFTVVNSNSPLRLDTPMSQGMIEFARHNQPIVMTPFTLAGAMAPITLAGALAQQNAEALGGITFMEVINPGTPAVYGGFTSTCSRALRRSARPSTRRQPWWAASWLAGTACRTAARTCAPPTRSTLRRHTRACSRCGAASWVASTS